MRAPAAGGSPTTIAGSITAPWAITTSGMKVFWTQDEVPVGGGTPMTPPASQACPVLIAVDATSVHWTNEGTMSLGSVMKRTPK